MSAISRARAFIFDFDGTLAPNLDLPDLRRRVIELTRSHQVPPPVFEDLYIVEIVEAAATWLGARAPDAGREYQTRAHQLITEFEMAAAAVTEPFPGVEKTLVSLNRAGKHLGVVTRNCRAAVHATFTDIGTHFQTILARDDVDHLKPDARHVTRALRELDASGNESVMVGDGQMDMTVGRELGMFCVGVLSGSSNADALRRAGANLVLQSVPELTTHLR